LTPGNDFLEAHLKDQRDTVDLVRRAAEFTVVPADVLGTGYHFASHDGQFVVPWEWELRPSNGEV